MSEPSSNEIQMKIKLKLLFITGLVFAGMMFVCPRIDAQISREQTQKLDDALLIVREQSLSSNFYDTLKSTETAKTTVWNLSRAFFYKQNSGENTIRTADFQSWYMMEFLDGKVRTQISICEYESPKKASEVLNDIVYSQGSIAGDKEFGDEAIKGFNGNGEFVGLRFRKNNFTIFISTKSKETAKLFAESALKILK